MYPFLNSENFNHFSPFSGHYVSDVKVKSAWNNFDDSFVKHTDETQEGDMLRNRESSAYILFYVHK